MTEASILEMFEYINEVLGIELQQEADISFLTSREWYLHTMNILFPFLKQEWNKIENSVHSEEAAIDRILLILTQEGAIPKQYIEQLKGKSVVSGNLQAISMLVEVINQFVQQALEEEAQGEQQTEQHQQQPEQEEEPSEQQQLSPNVIEKQENHPLIRNKTPMVTIKADSEPDLDRNVHSALGIGNEFEDEEQSGQNQHQNYEGEHQEFKNYYQKMGYNSNGYQSTNYKHQEEDQQDNYLNQKLNKCKSQEAMKHVPKQKTKKSKKVRALVAHPPIPKYYPKAVTKNEKKLTKNVKMNITGTRKQFDKENQYVFGSPAGKQQIDKKKRQMQFTVSDSKQFFKAKKGSNLKLTQKEQSVSNLKKLLKWKESNLKRQRREVQKDLQMKVQLKKQTYVKKINKLIIHLQKEKMLDIKRQEKERQKRENELAEKRLIAIEQQYRNQMAILNDKNSNSRKIINHTDHRSIIEGLQKELKKENQRQINALKTRLKREEAQLDDDLQALQREIIKVYKRN